MTMASADARVFVDYVGRLSDGQLDLLEHIVVLEKVWRTQDRDADQARD